MAPTKSQLPLILATAFLDILGMSLFIPVFPAIIQAFGVNSSWTGYSQAVYAVGMFLGGLFFGRLSDTYGRKKMLSYTSILNLIAYLIMLVSVWKLDIGTTTMGLQAGEATGIVANTVGLFQGFTPIFLLFLGARFIGGLGGAGFGVIQAYISDISLPSEKTKRMGMMGASFGLAFLVGPLVGGLLAKFTSVHTVIMLCSFIILLNVLSIRIFLKEPVKHVHTEEVHLGDFHFSKTVMVLLFLSFGATLGFAGMQSMSTQFYADRFSFDATKIGYTMAMVGVVSILYQGLLVRYVRKYLDEKKMIYVAFILLAIGFCGFSLNTSPIWLFFWIAFFPLGMGSFQPSVSSLIANKAGKQVGKVMGYNTSIQSIGQIFGPVLVGALYTHGSGLPFLVSACIFVFLLLVSLWGLNVE